MDWVRPRAAPGPAGSRNTRYVWRPCAPAKPACAAHGSGQALRASTTRGAASQCYRARSFLACRRASPSVRLKARNPNANPNPAAKKNIRNRARIIAPVSALAYRPAANGIEKRVGENLPNKKCFWRLGPWKPAWRLGFRRLVVKRAPVPLVGANSAVNPVDKSWKSKIDGKAQRTGNNGAHQVRTYREAIAFAKDPNVASVHLDHGYNRALELNPKTIAPNRRPDVTAIYNDRRVARVEVQSATDNPAILRSRNAALDAQLRAKGFIPLPPKVVVPTRSPK